VKNARATGGGWIILDWTSVFERKWVRFTFTLWTPIQFTRSSLPRRSLKCVAVCAVWWGHPAKGT
jgi:hypothetical protein